MGWLNRVRGSRSVSQVNTRSLSGAGKTWGPIVFDLVHYLNTEIVAVAIAGFQEQKKRTHVQCDHEVGQQRAAWITPVHVNCCINARSMGLSAVTGVSSAIRTELVAMSLGAPLRVAVIRSHLPRNRT